MDALYKLPLIITIIKVIYHYKLIRFLNILHSTS